MKRYSNVILILLGVTLLGCVNKYDNTLASNAHGSNTGLCRAFADVEKSFQRELQSRDSITRIFESLSCYGGGNLEDIYRAIGIVFTKQPIAVLAAIHDAQLSTPQISSVFTMLPLSFVDKPCEKVAELVRRKAILEASNGYLAERKKGLVAISESLSRVQPHCDLELP